LGKQRGATQSGQNLGEHGGEVRNGPGLGEQRVVGSGDKDHHQQTGSSSRSTRSPGNPNAGRGENRGKSSVPFWSWFFG